MTTRAAGCLARAEAAHSQRDSICSFRKERFPSPQPVTSRKAGKKPESRKDCHADRGRAALTPSMAAAGPPIQSMPGSSTAPARAPRATCHRARRPTGTITCGTISARPGCKTRCGPPQKLRRKAPRRRGLPGRPRRTEPHSALTRAPPPAGQTKRSHGGGSPPGP